jgi:hypothetical protein
MEDQNILSPGVFKSHNPNENWKTPVRATVRTLYRDGASYGQIKAKTGLTRSTIQYIVKSHTSRTTRKGKANKPTVLKEADVKRIFRFVSESWTNRTMS